MRSKLRSTFLKEVRMKWTCSLHGDRHQIKDAIFTELKLGVSLKVVEIGTTTKGMGPEFDNKCAFAWESLFFVDFCILESSQRRNNSIALSHRDEDLIVVAFFLDSC